MKRCILLIFGVVFLAGSSLGGFPVDTICVDGFSPQGLSNGRFHKGHRVIEATELIPAMTLKSPEPIWSGEALTVAAWVMPCNSKTYRTILFKGDRKQNNKIDFKLGLFDLFPEFVFTDVTGGKETWYGIMRGDQIISRTGYPNLPFEQCAKLAEGEWNFLAVVFAQGKIDMYLNGKLIHQAQTPIQKLPISNSEIMVGSGQYPGGGPATVFNGLIDGVRICDKALSVEELEAYRTETLQAHPAGPVDMNKCFVPPKTQVKNCILLKGAQNPTLSGAVYDPLHKVMYSPANNSGRMMVSEKLPMGKQFSFTVNAWIMPQANHDLSYRTILFSGKRSTYKNDVNLKFGLFKTTPEFAYTDIKGHWHGILRAGEELFCEGGKNVSLQNAPAVKQNRWNLLTATFSYGEMKMYLDGELIHTANVPNESIDFKGYPLQIGIGQDAGGAYAFALGGLLDDVSFSTGAMDAAAIKVLYQKGRADYPDQEIILSQRQVPEYDPQFLQKLDIVKKYEENLPVYELGNSSPVVDIRDYQGVPRIFRNGKPEAAMCMMPEPPVDNQGAFLAARDFAAAGVNYFSEIFFTYLNWGKSCQNWWKGYGEYDFAAIENRLQAFVDANPNARLILRIKVNAPVWWLNANPEERSVNEKGIRAPQPSLSSEKWMNDASQMLGDVVHHLERSKFAPHIVGYLPAGGECSEWYWWGVTTGFLDYSKTNGDAFRQYLQQKYPSVQALRQAWQSPNVIFETAEIPSSKFRSSAEDGFFRDPAKSRQVYDYRQFMTDATVKAILTVNQAVRANLASRKLVGSFYGYSMHVVSQLDNLGFQGLKTILDDPGVDFICAPTSYDRLGGKPGDYVCGYMGSLRLRQKGYYDEADMRTYLFNGVFPICHTTSETETREVNWRTFGNMLTQGTNIWWFLLAGNATFHTNNIMEDIARMSRLEKELLVVSKKQTAQVAVFCDEESLFYVNSSTLLQDFITKTQEHISYAGFPSDTFLLSDIDNPKLKEYKVYVFLNPYFITPAQREAIQKKLDKNHATALWVYAPGYLTQDGNSLDAMKALTGMTFEKIPSLTVKNFRLAVPLHPLGKGLNAPEEDQPPFVPGFAVADSEAEGIASLNGKTVIAAKNTTFGRSVYTMLPPSPELVRNLSDEAGVHIYCDSNDTVRANESFIMLHARTAGTKVLHLPRHCKVRNLKNGEISGPVKDMTMELAQGETALFQMLE